MTSKRQWIGLGVTVVVLVVLAVFAVSRFRTTTAITSFLSSPDEIRMAEISRQLADSELTRTMVLAVSAPELDAALAAAAALTDGLRNHPEIAWIRDRVEEGTDRAVYDLYFPRRFMFLSDRPDELDHMLSDEGLRESARDLKHQLGLPTAPLIKKIAPQDPWLLFLARARALEQAQMGSLAVRDDRFVTNDGRSAIVFLATVHSPFESSHQAPLEADLGALWTTVKQSHSGVELERSSIHRFALASEQAIRGDIWRISIASSVAIVLLFLVFFRSPRLMGLAFVPLVAGVIVATATSLAVNDELHGITLAFGATMIGVCIDYPVHFFTHHTLAPDPAGPWGTLRRVWMGLLLGALTTIAGFAGMAWTDFPAIRQIGVFGMLGIAAALFSTRVLLPPLMSRAPAPVALQHQVAAGLARLVNGMRRHRRGLIVLPAAALIVCAIGLGRLTWVDDATALNRLQPQMLEEDRRVRDMVARVDTGKFVIALGRDDEQALQRNDVAYQRLRAAADDGELEFTSVHAMLWSQRLQRDNLDRVHAMPDLAGRAVDALAGEGFRAGAFSALADALAQTPEPLRHEDLANSPLAPIVRPFRVTFGDEVAYLSFVRDVRDPDALAARLEGIEGVYDWDQLRFMERAYGQYRERVTTLMLIGLLGVGSILVIRYRNARLATAAFVPALLAAATTLAAFGVLGLELQILHVVGLLMVLSIGVDYGVFLVETADDDEGLSATVLSLIIACLSTVFAFGLLALSSNPALRAVGMTTGLGVLLSLVLAPTTLILSGGRRR